MPHLTNAAKLRELIFGDYDKPVGCRRLFGMEDMMVTQSKQYPATAMELRQGAELTRDEANRLLAWLYGHFTVDQARGQSIMQLVTRLERQVEA